jgi:hypothetical protein
MTESQHLQIRNQTDTLIGCEFTYQGNILTFIAESKNTDMLPDNVPIGVIMGGGQLQIYLTDNYGKFYESYIYHYTKHGTDERVYILDSIKENKNGRDNK